MQPLPIDHKVVDECRALAAQVAGDVQAFIHQHTTVAIERTVLRAYGVEGADPDGVPLVSTCIDRVRGAGKLGRGIARFLGLRLLRGAAGPQEAAEAIAYDADLETPDWFPPDEDIARVLEPHTRAAIERI